MLTPVMCCDELIPHELEKLSAAYSMEVNFLSKRQQIPGSYWGEREAGLKLNILHCRQDTPVHSALHELSHYVCMPSDRRLQLDTNAGGDYDEENGVCFLQILLAGYVAPMTAPRMMDDMDRWGYTFRLGSAKAWFENDAQDAHAWLFEHNIINRHSIPTWQIREL